MRAKEEFGGEVGHDANVLLHQRPRRRHPPIEQAIADHVGERQIPVVPRRVFRQRASPAEQLVDDRPRQVLGID